MTQNADDGQESAQVPVGASTGGGHPFPDVPFVIACVECDCDSPDSYEEAIAAGWTQISYAPEGFSSNFYGYCPEHRLWELERPESKLPEDQHGEGSP